METTIAFSADAPGNDFADLPSCLVLTITDALRQKILTAQTVAREHEFAQVVIRHYFETPVTMSEEVEEAIDGDEYAVVDPMEFDEAEDRRADCHFIVIDDSDLWLRCRDHYGDYQVESPLISIRDVLALKPWSPDKADQAA